jgi:hypothetical protein
MSDYDMSEEEKQKLIALSMKKAFRGTDEDEEEEIRNLRKKKLLQAAVNKTNR